MLWVLDHILCDLGVKVKDNVFFVYASPKPLEVATSNFLGA